MGTEQYKNSRGVSPPRLCLGPTMRFGKVPLLPHHIIICQPCVWKEPGSRPGLVSRGERRARDPGLDRRGRKGRLPSQPPPGSRGSSSQPARPPQELQVPLAGVAGPDKGTWVGGRKEGLRPSPRATFDHYIKRSSLSVKEKLPVFFKHINSSIFWLEKRSDFAAIMQS